MHITYKEFIERIEDFSEHIGLKGIQYIDSLPSKVKEISYQAFVDGFNPNEESKHNVTYNLMREYCKSLREDGGVTWKEE